MIRAMSAAMRRPQVFGLREDKQQRALEERVADLTAMEDALLFPTCTMANQAAIQTLCRPGRTVLLDATSHIATSEAGGPAALAGLTLQPVPAERGRMDPAALAAALAAPADALRARPGLIVLENTHNRSGGGVLPPSYHRRVRRLAAGAGIPIHLDGARLFNAAVAAGRPVRDFTRPMTSVALSLNKGLCAPLGAMLAGPKGFIAEALAVRQRLGGGIRPTGAVAAAGLIAIETMIDRLGQDHANAKRLARALAEIGVACEDVETNLVVVLTEAFGIEAAASVRRLADAGLLALAFGPGRIRLAVHRGIGRREIERTVRAFASVARPVRGGKGRGR